jgi:hypothetical protein
VLFFSTSTGFQQFVSSINWKGWHETHKYTIQYSATALNSFKVKIRYFSLRPILFGPFHCVSNGFYNNSICIAFFLQLLALLQWLVGGPKCKISVYALKNLRHYSFWPPSVHMSNCFTTLTETSQNSSTDHKKNHWSIHQTSLTTVIRL